MADFSTGWWKEMEQATTFSGEADVAQISCSITDLVGAYASIKKAIPKPVKKLRVNPKWWENNKNRFSEAPPGTLNPLFGLKVVLDEDVAGWKLEY